jgi:hypothetical protein
MTAFHTISPQSLILQRHFILQLPLKPAKIIALGRLAQW